MRFTKMQGAGNDYVYINCFAEQFPADPAEVARQMSDRHFGVGGDGVIYICPSNQGADAWMRMFNADGSESEMCGNGLRCVAKFVHDHGIKTATQLRLQTGAGILTVDLEVKAGKAHRVRVNMGQPIIEAAKIPTLLPGNPPVNATLEAGGRSFEVTSVSMGNPHCVVFVPEATDELVLGIGPKIEHSPMFPRRVNVEFVEVLSRTELRQRTWERGSGETLACGTGASAVCVAGVLTGRTQRKVTIHLLGGDLELEWNEADNCIYKTGPAVEVFSGEWVGG
ncbi:diaminopimelate epimerase [Pirellula staleyi DSM 6068]|uniref:Diaminopimelate epimerase n=1 Tax=Pirellula staleyi (strain ATCC 27377 / DSM 6068 / ICPB 4128) TaxID=530564 RepID=D2R217_PIRSD|nr:diaminopimelate epimerase [Pirellula staleyi]ADB18628.1 diaminopimelate epimerase [Pirellula staleyi DSM 6068]